MPTPIGRPGRVAPSEPDVLVDARPALVADTAALGRIGYRPEDYAAILGAVAPVFAPIPAHDAPGPGERDFEVAFWNVANFGPPIDDPEADGWVARNRAQYEEKLAVIGRGIRLMGDGHGPDLLGLAEIGGMPVLDDLCRTHLEGLGYRPVHLRTPDARGMDIAILSKLELVGAPKLHEVSDANPTRGILEARFDAGGTELIALVTHWPARGPGDYNLARRTSAARVLRELVERLQSQNEGAEVLVMGDFNELVDGAPMKTLGASADRRAVERGDRGALLLHSAASMASRASGKPAHQLRSLEAVRNEERRTGAVFGSYHFDGEEDWRSLDAVMGNKNLVDDRGLSLVEGSEAVVRHPLLLRQNGRPRGNAGSDHLPVRAIVRRRADG